MPAVGGSQIAGAAVTLMDDGERVADATEVAVRYKGAHLRWPSPLILTYLARFAAC